MIVETSASVLRSRIEDLLVDFLQSDGMGEDIALQLVEVIALRMRTREDHEVAAVGTFVRANLMLFCRGEIDYLRLLARLTAAACQAPLGHTALVRTLKTAVRR